MRWHEVLPWHRRTAAETMLDIGEVVAAGLRDRSAARRAIHDLRRERKRVERELRALHARSRRLTPDRMRKIVGSDPDRVGPELGVYQFAQALQEQNDQEAGTKRGSQLAALEARLEAIDAAQQRLLAYLHFGP